MGTLLKEVQAYVNELELSQIPAERKTLLLKLSDYIQKELISEGEIRLNFICTHNSRRSQLCKLWMRVASFHYGLNGIHVASGGTEATALHENIVSVLKKCGFQISKAGNKENAGFLIRFSDALVPSHFYSKTYTDSFERKVSYTAIMTCADAEENCPYIPEAAQRFSLTYADPKNADSTAHEAQTYSNCNRQIATEMFFVISEALKNKI